MRGNSYCSWGRKKDGRYRKNKIFIFYSYRHSKEKLTRTFFRFQFYSSQLIKFFVFFICFTFEKTINGCFASKSNKRAFVTRTKTKLNKIAENTEEGGIRGRARAPNFAMRARSFFTRMLPSLQTSWLNVFTTRTF